MERINEKLINDNPIIISFECTKKILEQMKKCVCKITFGKEKGTGFFCKIPFPDKNNMILVFITNNHVINKLNEKIIIYIEEECEERKILINNDRMIYMNDDKKYDITIVEIKEEDNIANYLELDDNIIDDILNNEINIKNAKYNDNKVYAIQYPDGNLSVSFGIIQGIFEERKYEFQHKCSTMFGSSGSPILNLKNNKLIGIHKQGALNYNIATFLNGPIKEFINININNKKNINYKCHVGGMKIKNAKKIDIESLFNTQNTFREYISNKIKNKNNSFKPSLIINSSVSNLLNKTTNKQNPKIRNRQQNLSQSQPKNSPSIIKKRPVNHSSSSSNSIIINNTEAIKTQKNQSDDVFLTYANSISNKRKRLEEQNKDKKIKFNLNMINKDYLNQLRKQSKSLFTEKFSNKIFSDDFQKQAEALKAMNEQIYKNKNIRIYLDNLEFILKIIGINISSNLNIKITKKLFEFFDLLFYILFNNKHKLNDTESNIIMSVLINHLSLNNNALKEQLLSLLNKYIEFLNTNKIMVTVINISLNKNNKIKTDILDLAINLVNKEKLNISTKVYAKLFCKFLSSNENVIKSKALFLFQEIFYNMGEKLWKIIENEDFCKDEDEIENDDINNEINNSEGEDKNEIFPYDESENNGEINFDDKKESDKDSEIMEDENENGIMAKKDIDKIKTFTDSKLDINLSQKYNFKNSTIPENQKNFCELYKYFSQKKEKFKLKSYENKKYLHSLTPQPNAFKSKNNNNKNIYRNILNSGQKDQSFEKPYKKYNAPYLLNNKYLVNPEPEDILYNQISFKFRQKIHQLNNEVFINNQIKDELKKAEKIREQGMNNIENKEFEKKVNFVIEPKLDKVDIKDYIIPEECSFKNNINNNDITEKEKEIHNALFRAKVNLVVNNNMDEDEIIIYPGDDVEEKILHFCLKHKLNEEKKNNLMNIIMEKIEENKNDNIKEKNEENNINNNIEEKNIKNNGGK